MRNSPFYVMTFMVPILVLTVLAPVGLIIPGKSCNLNKDKILISRVWRKTRISNYSLVDRVRVHWLLAADYPGDGFNWECPIRAGLFRCSDRADDTFDTVYYLDPVLISRNRAWIPKFQSKRSSLLHTNGVDTQPHDMQSLVDWSTRMCRAVCLTKAWYALLIIPTINRNYS